MEMINLTDRKLKELYYANYTYKQIAEMYECSTTHISRKVTRLIKEGYIIKRANVKKLLFENLENQNCTNINNRRRITYNEVISLYENNISVKDIASLLECSIDAIYKAIQEYRKINKIEQRVYRRADNDYIIELYNKGLTFEQISKLASCYLSTTSRIISIAIANNIIENRKYDRIANRDIRLIEMFRDGESVKNISKILRLPNRIVDGKIQYFINRGIIIEEYMMKNIFINNKDIIIKAYMNGISCKTIAWYLKIGTNIIKEYIGSNQYSVDSNIINDMIINKKPIQISKELQLPVDLIYLHLKDII